MLKGEKGVVSDLLTFFIWGIMLLFIVVFVIYFKQISDNNAFSQYTSDVISRYGGLTDEAMAQLQDYNETYFDGRYVIEVASEEKESYGTVVQYTVVAKLRILYFDLPADLKFSGIAVIKMR